MANPPDAIDRLAAPDFVVHRLGGPGAPPMIGPAEFKKLFHTFRNALGDLTVTVERSVVEGETCAVYCRVQGRHVGDAFGGPPTGNPVDFNGVTICVVSDGRLVEGWNCFDFLTMYQQIGWVTNPPLP